MPKIHPLTRVLWNRNYNINESSIVITKWLTERAEEIIKWSKFADKEARDELFKGILCLEDSPAVKEQVKDWCEHMDSK